MGISQKDIKLLWGRAASRCAFPECRRSLTQDALNSSESSPLGEQAHIIGEKEDAARGISPLSLAERNSYANLILLCPTHHTEIDKLPEDYPVERLHKIKIDHQLWVEQSLASTSDARKVAQDSIYTELIDTAQLACPFDEWDQWVSIPSPICHSSPQRLERRVTVIAMARRN